ncbi:hypothetical protein [Natronococcus sp.]|uniref:hypothetical protein n=1 Tax=Natronococcus sp. TaxID=35747 RepID=UPI003A4DD7C0
MCNTFTDDDIGSRVETADGETVGVVAAVDGAVARVCPPPAADGSDTAAPAMATGPDETRPLEPEAELDPTDPDRDPEAELSVDEGASRTDGSNDDRRDDADTGDS